jgi:L-2,4-diaminobutyric acid acetyltransferase
MLYRSSQRETLLRKPHPDEGQAIHQLIQHSPPLDLNSSYSYYLLTRHFADTCVVAEHHGQLVGFVSAYVRPDAPDTLFVWQVVVAPSQRGQGLARLMLSSLLARPECRAVDYVESTINPSNLASRRLFERFAEQHDLPVEESLFLDEGQFGDTSHEAEIKLSIGPLHAHSQQEKRHAYL